MKITIDRTARVRFNWVTLNELSKVRRFLTKFVKAGNEYMEVSDSSHQQLDGQLAGSIVIEIFEYSVPYIEEHMKKLS